MSDWIVVDNDPVMFEPMFGNRVVTVIGPVVIRGTGGATIDGRRICIVGDEKKVQAQATYIAGPFVGGQGRVMILQLLPNQQAPLCTTGAPMIIKGQQFSARFIPTVPATNSSGAPDPMMPSIGKGRFITTQLLARAQ
ncbi:MULTISPECIES: hypothetical protein [Burkholderiaceae]|uniref:hypothetical protein n=1 Tax=Burkholderiaceae TaxID=119060 RepID=UPI00095BCFE1|nr:MULTISPECIES: hypothetical protein [Burkholderiaceae]MCG1040899.1 hypothetical protein [Mycetohabitans sp. B7]SIT64869.1 hypothetical protein SAMN04487769_0072 [Burkholderia sp. b14]